MTEKELRELDAEIHRKVFGREVKCLHLSITRPRADSSLMVCDHCKCEFGVTTLVMEQSRIPRYSSDIAAAWLVVKWLRAKGRCPNVAALHNGGWFVDLDDPIESASGETAPIAICRAALKAVTPSEAPAHV